MVCPALNQNKDAIADAKDLTTVRRGKIKRIDPKLGKQRRLIALSLLLAAIEPVLMWCSRTQPLLVVWRLSFLIYFMSSLWTSFLTTTMGVHVFVYNAFGILLALIAHMVLSTSIGVLILHCNTHLTICLAAYALAEHRQQQGTEGSAALVPDVAKGEESTLRPFCIIAGVMIYVPVLAVLVWLAWNWANFPLEELMCIVFFVLSVLSLFGIFFTAMMELRGRLISPLGYTFVAVYFVMVFAPGIVIYETLGGFPAMFFTWFGSLGLAGLFGYCLSVLTTFKQIKRARELAERQSKRN
ncbi:hypothetical protein EJB05_43311, partial [Eragrostis curvula]